MLPVVRRRADGTLSPHVRLLPGTLGQPAERRPAIATNPCDCKCDNTPGPHGPYPNCAACFADIKGIKVEVSGFVNHICDETFYSGGIFPQYTGTDHMECLGENLNGSHSLTHLEWESGTTKQFSLTYAASGSCAGLLVGQHTFTDNTGKVCTGQGYVQKLWGGVGCLGNSLCFGLSLQEYHACGPSNCPLFDSAGFLTPNICQGTATIDAACNIGAASTDYQFDQNCNNRGVPSPPRTGNCVFPPYTVTYKFRPIW